MWRFFQLWSLTANMFCTLLYSKYFPTANKPCGSLNFTSAASKTSAIFNFKLLFKTSFRLFSSWKPVCTKSRAGWSHRMGRTAAFPWWGHSPGHQGEDRWQCVARSLLLTHCCFIAGVVLDTPAMHGGMMCVSTVLNQDLTLQVPKMKEKHVFNALVNCALNYFCSWLKSHTS